MDYVLIVSFFIIAAVYASVGFGGGTSYLALMALMAVPFEFMRPAGLICNLVVVTGGCVIFYREGLLELKRIWPFMVFSVPLASLGGYYPIQEQTFFRVLGITLVVAAVLLWFFDRYPEQERRADSNPWIAGSFLGGGIGFLSGLVAIGGGIFLSPLLHFLRWDSARRISALASAFIFVNSVAGLLGQFTFSYLDRETPSSGPSFLSGDFITFLLPLMLAVLAGGQLGSRWGAQKFQASHIRKVTAVLILVAGANILINHWS